MNYKEQAKEEMRARLLDKIPESYVAVDTSEFGSMAYPLQSLIQQAFHDFKWNLVNVLVDELHSDEKFEQDIGLR